MVRHAKGTHALVSRHDRDPEPRTDREAPAAGPGLALLVSLDIGHMKGLVVSKHPTRVSVHRGTFGLGFLFGRETVGHR